MARHSKWHNIKHRKAASDSKRGKVFTRHAKLITISAKQGGGDPEMNPLLRSAIDSAKEDNVPNDNIERAIKKGTGELKDDIIIEEIYYNAFGPAGVALYIEVLTDNKNRAITNVKNILNKRGGRFADSGSVGWMFKKRGLITIDLRGKNQEELELMAIDAGADDIQTEDDLMFVYTKPEQLMKVRLALGAGKSAELIYDADNKVLVKKDSPEFEQLSELIEYLEEDEDVSNVYVNAEIVD
jgi:YebC/PmpR family DNA-binding regulatory protein